MLLKFNRNPSSLDKEPYKTWWFADIADDNMFIYMQISQDIDQPKWIKINNIVDGMPHIILDSLSDMVCDCSEENYQPTKKDIKMFEAFGMLSDESLTKE